MGLDKCSKGDWKTISRNFVRTRTPLQISSHAQKYFNRLNSTNKQRKRSSMHDITNINNGNGDVSVPITGQTNGSAEGGSSATGVVGLYGLPTMRQPIGGLLVSTVGTLVNLAPLPVYLPPPPHLAYGVGSPIHVHCGVGAPFHGPVVPGARMNKVPVSYLVKQLSEHR